MTRVLVAALLLLAVASGGSLYAQDVPAKGAPETFEVATWNVEWFGNTRNGPSDEERQLQNVRVAIEQSEIDLWALQEIDDEAHFNRLVSELGPDYRGELDQASTNLRVGFIYRNDVVRARIVKSMTMDATTRNLFAGRPPLQMEADVTVADTTVTITFITLHMKAFSDVDSYDRRKSASEFLKNRIDFTSLSNAPVIVLGDFNDELTRSITFGRASPYENFVSDTADFFFPSLRIEEAGLDTWCSNSSCTSGSAIDHVLITDELFSAYEPDSADRYEELISAFSSYTTTTSDHLPVYARFSFREATAVYDGPETASFGLGPVYPNPLASRAEVPYSLGAAGHVTIDVLDLHGRRVEILEDAFLPNGEHSASLEAVDLAAGIYFIRLQSAGHRLLSPFVVAR